MHRIFAISLIISSFLFTTAAQAKHLTMGYYTNWGTYKNFPVGSTTLNAQAKLLDIIAYAFLEVDQSGSLYFSDPWSDLDQRDAGFCQSNSAICNHTTVTQGLGNFSKLTRDHIYPNTKIIISVGGAGHDASFHQAFANTKNFLASLDAIITTYKIDGIDLDFEPSSFNQQDITDYLSLAKSIHNQFPKLLITAAVTANPDTLKQISSKQWQDFATNVNYVSIMAYDLHGGFDGIGNNTGFHSNLYSDDHDTYHTHYSADLAVQTLIKLGVPSKQIMLGIPAYGRATTHIADHQQHGLYQPIGGLYTQGDLDGEMESYSSIITTWLNNGFTLYKYNLPNTRLFSGTYAYDSNKQIFIAFDSAELVAAKAKYVDDNQLAGLMMWELRADLPPTHPQSLLKAM